MAIDIELAGLKAAGTYRFERDLSTLSSGISTGAYSNLRLVVGFSKKGPFNSVQLITSSSQFIKLYGNIDRSLEKRGSYFHRSALVALSAGPILCLNLLTLNPDEDQVMHRSISANIKKYNKNICTIPYQTVYNTDKFWFLSSETYLDSVHTFDNEHNNGNNILNFTNVGNKPISVLVKKASAKNTKGYEVTLNEWFGAENVPEYLNGTSFVSDYMVEVYVIGGDFGPELTKTVKGSTNGNDNGIIIHNYTDDCSKVYSEPDVHPYKRFASDITYQEYFDKYGFKADKLSKFLGLPSVNVIATYVGSLLPNFINKLNQNIWIEDMINKDTLTTGLLCSEDVDMIESATINEDAGFVNEAIDIIGHNFHHLVEEYSVNSTSFLSYALSQSRIEELDNSNSDNESLTYLGELNIHLKPANSQYFINDNGTPLNVDATNEVIMDMDIFTNDKSIKVGDMLLSYVSESYDMNEDDMFSRLTRVVEIKPLYIYKDGKYAKDPNHIRVICSDSVKVSYDSANGSVDYTKPYVSKYATVDSICDRYHWTFLKGFKVSENSMPGGKNDQERNSRQNEILNMINQIFTMHLLIEIIYNGDM